MKIKSSQTLVEEAEKNIETLSAKQTKEIINSKNGLLIDVRDIRELWKEGTVKNSKQLIPNQTNCNQTDRGSAIHSKLD